VKIFTKKIGMSAQPLLLDNYLSLLHNFVDLLPAARAAPPPGDWHGGNNGDHGLGPENPTRDG
jgi:hypothetical protein